MYVKVFQSTILYMERWNQAAHATLLLLAIGDPCVRFSELLCLLHFSAHRTVITHYDNIVIIMHFNNCI